MIKKTIIFFMVVSFIILAACGEDSTQADPGFLFTEPFPDSDTLAQTIFSPALMLYHHFEGLGDIKLNLANNRDYFYSDEHPDYFIEQVNGQDYEYVPVNDERFPTFQSFVDELRVHFSEELVQELLSTRLYIEHNGKFYVSGGARGTNANFVNVTYAVTSQTPDKVIFTATAFYIKYPEGAEYSSGDYPNVPAEMLESKEFVYNYEQIDGKWVFTTFQLFY